VYDATLAANVPPQLVHSLRNSGYECHFLTAGDCNGFRDMDKFLNEDFFDSVVTEKGGDWQNRPERDRRVLEQVRRLASQPSEKPKFIMAFLMSTHFPYTCPAEFELHQPTGDDVTYAGWQQLDRDVLRNRYRNAALFLEDEIVRLHAALAAEGTVFVVTGDHGESLGEDDALGHATRGSEVQCRVPMLIFGGPTPEGIVIDRPTTHADLTPTLLHLLNAGPVEIEHVHGRDLLQDNDALEDRVLICPHRWKDPRQLVLVRGKRRMLFEVRLNRPEIRVFGPCDEQGRLRLERASQTDAQSADEWAQELFEEMLRLTR
jgi:membrane-anchored protein YejM (alkaline phosphatase superfamily)